MKAWPFLALVVCLTGHSLAAFASDPTFWNWAATPPMGWNSYDAFGESVTEDEVLANARYLKEHLLSFGWQYVVIDYRWYDGTVQGGRPADANVPLAMDAFGRLMPAVNRFPSAAGELGFRPLADKIHALGLKFGIHLMRGIPRQAVRANTPIEGSGFRAADAADTTSTCDWNADMYGVMGSTPAGQAWYDSVLRQCADWGVDFIKVDDLSLPYSDAEIEAVRKAIEKTGRPIVFSTSPGDAPLAKGGHLAANTNMWRIKADYWDKWPELRDMFRLLDAWTPYRGHGHWPDADMLPLGKLAIRCPDGGAPHMTHFTRDEQVTMMTLWCIARSPLMLGGNLPENDAFTLSLLTNDEVLAVDQNSSNNRQWSRRGDSIAWVADVPESDDRCLALFNLGQNQDGEVSASLSELGIAGSCRVRDLWAKKDLGPVVGQFRAALPPHGAALYRLSP